jgi:hypothetical protein
MSNPRSGAAGRMRANSDPVIGAKKAKTGPAIRQRLVIVSPTSLLARVRRGAQTR